MAEARCTCGFPHIPAEAQYCPGCGRPLTAEALESERQREALQTPPVDDAEPPPAMAPIGFSNLHAVRACYWSGAAAALISGLPFMSLFFFIWFPAAGFFSVASFRRRSGLTPTVRGGAKLGLLTGVMAFAVSLLLLVASSLVPGAQGLTAALGEMQQQFEENGQQELASRLGAVLDDPLALALFLLFALTFTFGVIAACTVAGGALGGKVLKKD